MKIKENRQLIIAAIVCAWFSAPCIAAPLQQGPLAVPLQRPTEPRSDADQDAGDTPVIRPRTPGRLPTTPFQPPEDLTPESDQAVVLNAMFAGWEGASGAAAGRRITNDLRGNWIMVDETGMFDGIVVPTEGANVAGMNVFLMHAGRLVKQTSVDQDGRFRFTNVRQGAYALTGWGPNGIFTFGLNILASNPNATDALPPNSVTVTAFQNETTINTDWIRYYSPQVGFRVYGRYPEGEGAKSDPGLYGTLGLYNNLPKNQPATSISSHVVNRTSDGRLVGRVHQFTTLSGRPVDVRTTKVLLLENDSVVAATTADNHGVFEFLEVPNGSYGILAAGVDGVGLIGITVGNSNDGAMSEADADQDIEVGIDDLKKVPVAIDKMKANSKSTAQLIDFTMVPAETVGWLNAYATEVAYQRNLNAPRRPAPTDPLRGCQNCQNQPGGCHQCQQDYLRSTCRSRGISFEQWQIYGCQGVQSGFGDGRFIRELGETLRGQIDRSDRFFENAFSPDNSDQILGELGVPSSPAAGAPTAAAPGFSSPTFSAPAGSGSR